MKTTLLVLTLNEIEGMKAIMPRVKREWFHQIVVLDGNSTDGTIEYAREQGYTVYVQKRRGPRFAYEEVQPLIEGDVVITFSPDGNSVPEVLPQLIARMEEGYDMVIASRYLAGAKSHDDSCITAFGNWVLTRLINILHGGHYTDAMVIYRAYKKDVISRLRIDQADGYIVPERLFHTVISWEPLLSVRAARQGLRIGEIPGDEPPRIGSQSKLQTVRWGLSYLYQIIRESLP